MPPSSVVVYRSLAPSIKLLFLVDSMTNLEPSSGDFAIPDQILRLSLENITNSLSNGLVLGLQEENTVLACARDEHAARVKSLEADLATLKAQQEATAKEKAAAEQSTAELKQQLTTQAQTLQQAQKGCDEHAARVKSLEADLATLKAQQEATAKEKAAAEQSTAELKQQLTTQAQTLQQAQKGCDEHAARVKSLEADLATLKAQQDDMVSCLRRLRQLAQSTGQIA